MRAVVLHDFGAPDRLAVEDVPDPKPARGEVVVAVAFAGITFVEHQMRSGLPPNPQMLPRLPLVLGNGVGGHVVGVGAGVDPELLGRRVVTTTGGSGGYAERVTVDAGALVDVPEQLALADAVALLADGRTAIGLIDVADIATGDTVLVEAAGGGVGSLLVQLARRAGAFVVATAGGSRKLSLAKELGAQVAIDYSSPGWAGQVRADRGAVDVVFDGVGGAIGVEAFGLLAQGGRFVPYGMASGAFSRLPDDDIARRGITIVRLALDGLGEMNALTRRALDLAANGELRPVVGQVFPLERAADAHEAIAARDTVGKTLLVVGSSPIDPPPT